MRIETWLTSDGRAYFVRLNESDTLLSDLPESVNGSQAQVCFSVFGDFSLTFLRCEAGR